MSSKIARKMAVVAGLAVMMGPAVVAADTDASLTVEPPPEIGVDDDEEIEESDLVAGEAAPAATDDGLSIQLHAGLKGGLAGSAGDGFENDEHITDDNGNRVPSGHGQWPYPEYYPHFGTGANVGVAGEVRLNNIVGIETGFHHSRDNASGYVDKDHAQTNQTIARIHSVQRTAAYHFPLLLKLNIDAEVVRPFIAGGMNFIVQGSSDLEYTQEERAGRYGNEGAMDELNERNQIEESSYVQVAAAAGVEISIAGMVKIPIELRAGYTLGYGDRMSQRARGEDGQIIYDGVYMGNFAIMTGALIELDLL